MKVLGISGSPRSGGNTDLLLGSFLEGARSQGAKVIPLYLREKTFSPCREIYACLQDGCCCLQDDMQGIYRLLREADAIALASPIFFYGLPAQAKAMIDRCQSFWVERYILKRTVRAPSEGRRLGVFLSVAGTRGDSVFEGPLLTVKYFFDCLEVDLYRSLLYRKIDRKGEIREHPTALSEAFALGKEVVEVGTGRRPAARVALREESFTLSSPWIALLADSHDHVSFLHRAVEICNRRGVGIVLHAGDFVAPFSLAPLERLQCPYAGVFGNNDGEKVGLENRSGGRLKPGPRLLSLGNRRILLVHDLQQVLTPGGKGRVDDPAPDLIVHGHTHHAEVRQDDTVLIVNPGEVGGWLTGKASLALVQLESMEVEMIPLSL
jgi:putative phosphoesterase